jgi:hypothetical protein
MPWFTLDGLQLILNPVSVEGERREGKEGRTEGSLLVVVRIPASYLKDPRFDNRSEERIA